MLQVTPRRPEPDPARKTVRFRELGEPEQEILGVMYDTFGPSDLEGHTPIVYQNTAAWPYAGTGASDGIEGPAIIGYEVDRFFSEHTSLLPQQTFLSRSPYTSIYGHEVYQRTSIHLSDAQSWVFAAGTMAWSWGLDRDGLVDGVLQGLTRNILNEFLDPRHMNEPTPAPDLSTPIVSIEAPIQGEVLQPGILPLRGQVSDSSGQIVSVQLTVRSVDGDGYLLIDGALGDKRFHAAQIEPGDQQTNGVWSFEIAAVPPGNYQVVAQATDGDGNTTAVSGSTFHVRNEQEIPAVTIRNPAAGAVVSGPITTTGTAADQGAGLVAVELLVRDVGTGMYLMANGLMGGWQLLPADLDQPDSPQSDWSFPIDGLAGGSYYVAARSRDLEGNRSSWATATFTVT